MQSKLRAMTLPYAVKIRYNTGVVPASYPAVHNEIQPIKSKGSGPLVSADISSH